MPSTLLLSMPSRPSADDVRPVLDAAGWTIIDHLLGSTPAVDFGPIHAAIIDPGERLDLAAAQTRRWRSELGDDLTPILWLLPAASADAAAEALDAGADAVLARPFSPRQLVAQVKAHLRTHASAHRLVVKAAETRLLGSQLQKAYAQIDRELEMARRVHRSFLPNRFPEVGPARFSVCYRPRSRVGGDFYNVARLDESHVGFILGDVMAQGAPAASLLSVFIQQSTRMKEITAQRYRLVPPEEVLSQVNQSLIGLGLDDPPLAAMLVGLVDVATGTLTVARAGGPPPIRVPRDGEPEVWKVMGPFLGTADTTYQSISRPMAAGDKLLLASDGARVDGQPAVGIPDPLVEAAVRHRHHTGQSFVDAVARDLLAAVRHPDDFTLLALEFL